MSILRSRQLEARNPKGAGFHALMQMQEQGALSAAVVDKALASQRVVCFSEAPLEQAWSFVVDIRGRHYRLQPYGLAFTKEHARRMGVNPIWYIDMTRGHDWLTRHVEALIKRAVDAAGDFVDDPIAKIVPFMEGMGTWEESKKEFWWEREWRHLGDLSFSLRNVAVVLCPESEMEDLQGYVKSASGREVPLIDPTWGLEYIIARLARLPPKE